MTQSEKRTFLIDYLLKEQGESPIQSLDETEQKRLLRSLMNVRMPKPAGENFLAVQDEYLQEELKRKGITRLSSLTPVKHDIYLWKGDITTLEADGIVNAANARMLGCFCPCHGCIDNAIHTYAGVQLRMECARLMQKQGREEQTGKAKITKAYNLPCKYVLHTVGPIVYGKLTKKEENELASCYVSCLELAKENRLESVAFCCISTGEFRFPPERAAEIAVNTVEKWNENNHMKVIFNVFKESDYEIYARLLG